MKILNLFLIICVLSVSVTAQSATVHGEVVYRYVSNHDIEKTLTEVKKNRPEMYTQQAASMRRTAKYMNELRFSLLLNNSRALWKSILQPLPDDPEQAMEFQTALILAMEAKQGVYLDTRAKERYYQAEVNGAVVNVRLPLWPYRWKLTGREKCVSARTLLEAVTQEEQTSYRGEVTTRTIYAWYTPDIPLPFGPNGFDGLPGLVMEVWFGEDRKQGFQVETVDLSRSKANGKEIKKPKAVDDLTEGEYQKMIMGIMPSNGG